MKNKLLPDTDLARVALFESDKKREALRRFKGGYSTLSYKPFRDAVSGIFNARKSLFDDLPQIDWDQIEAAIKRSCSRADWFDPNRILAEALYDYVQSASCKAVEKDFLAVPIGFGARLKLWHDFYYIQDGAPVICFMDPRRSGGLTETGRRFAFSVMHHNLAQGDFSGARFQIFQFPNADDEGKKRVAKVHDFNEADLLSETEVNAAINDTYKIWQEVLEEREQEIRRAAGGGKPGGFGF